MTRTDTSSLPVSLPAIGLLLVAAAALACTGNPANSDAGETAPQADGAIADSGVSAPVDSGTEGLVDATAGGFDATSTTPDGGLIGLCNPVNQTGCNAGEKCAQLVLSDEPFLAQTTCVPNGSVPAGGECVQGDPGQATGYDDCVAGLHCQQGTCSEICTIGPPDSCSEEDDSCVLHANLFDDIGDNNIGTCLSACDPVTGHLMEGGAADPDASCLQGQGCYLAAVLGSSTCANVPAPATNRHQNMDCYGPQDATGSQFACFLNGCAAGFAPIHNNPLVPGSPVSWCSLFCTPQNSYDDQPCAPGATCPPSGNPTGDPSTHPADGQVHDCSSGAINAAGGGLYLNPPHQCRFIQSFYNNTDLVPASVGMCVSTAHRGDCRDYPASQLEKAFTDCANQMPECTNDEYEQAFEDVCDADLSDPNNPDFGNCEAAGCTSLAFDTYPDLPPNLLFSASTAGVSVSDLIKGRLRLREFLARRLRPTFRGQIPLPDGRVMDFSEDPSNPTIR